MPDEMIMHGGSGITASQTPIEIALGIDEAGMTTARKLYAFLELNPSNYSRWCKKNIINNEFAEESIDYLRLVFYDETPTGGKVKREDFKLSSTFSKKLAMIAGGVKGEEARDYFIRTEDALKQVALHRSAEFDQLKVENFNLMVANNAIMKQLDVLEQRQSAIEDKMTSGLSNRERAVMAECLTKLAGVLAVPVHQKAHSYISDDPPLTEKQLDSIRSSVRACVERQMKWIELNKFVLPPKSKSGVQSIIRMNIHAAIKAEIGVRHTQAVQSQYDIISKVIWNYKVSQNLINRIYSYTQNWVDRG